MIKKILTDFGIDVTLMLAGLTGALLMVARTATKNIRASLIGIISGTLSANYLTQIVVDFVHMEGKNKYGVAFLLGYIGLKGVETIITSFTKTIKDKE